MMRHQRFTWGDFLEKLSFNSLITKGPAFQFDMFEIARIREEIGTLIDNLSTLYKKKDSENKSSDEDKIDSRLELAQTKSIPCACGSAEIIGVSEHNTNDESVWSVDAAPCVSEERGNLLSGEKRKFEHRSEHHENTVSSTKETELTEGLIVDDVAATSTISPVTAPPSTETSTTTKTTTSSTATTITITTTTITTTITTVATNIVQTRPGLCSAETKVTARAERESCFDQRPVFCSRSMRRYPEVLRDTNRTKQGRLE